MAYSLPGFIQQYANRGIVVDTNILLVLFFGALGPSRLSQRRGTENFSEKDYKLLNLVLAQFKAVVTTPNILTEVSSFINNLAEPDRSSCYRLLAVALEDSPDRTLLEVYLPSEVIASLEWPFSKYGLTDCGIAEVAYGKYLVLTDDSKFASYLRERDIDTISFDDLRYWQ